MRRILVVAAALAALSSTACLGALLKRQLKGDMLEAPVIPNPVTAGAGEPSTYTVDGATSYTLKEYSAGMACFDVRLAREPELAQRLVYRLQGYRTPDDPDELVKSQANAQVRILDSRSELRPVTETVTDTFKDENGRVIGTQERQVQNLRTFFTTVAEVCFQNPAVIARETGYLVFRVENPDLANTVSTALYGDTSWSYGVWRLAR